MPAAIGLHAIDAGLSALELVIDYDSASDAIFAAFTTPPSPTRKGQIDTCVLALKSAGVWAKLDWLYLLAAADSQAAKINWKNPGTYNCTEVNAPTFTADRGFTGASTKYLDTGFNTSTATTPNFTRNSACIFGHERTDFAGIGSIVGGAGANLLINSRNATDTYNGRVNCTATTCTGASTNSIGFWSVNRSGASASEMYKNGSSVDTDTGASLPVASENAWLLRSVSNYRLSQISCAGMSSSLNSTEQTDLYNAINTYLVAVGAA